VSRWRYLRGRRCCQVVFVHGTLRIVHLLRLDVLPDRFCTDSGPGMFQRFDGLADRELLWI
jgi:hypothetical protein